MESSVLGVNPLLQSLSVSRPGQLTPKAKKLYQVVKSDKRRELRLRAKIASLKEQLRQKQIWSVQWLMSQGVNRLTAEFIRSQLRMQRFQPRGRRYNQSMKALGIALFKRSPAQYRVFNKIFCMPQRQTLKNVSIIRGSDEVPVVSLQSTRVILCRCLTTYRSTSERTIIFSVVSVRRSRK